MGFRSNTSEGEELIGDREGEGDGILMWRWDEE